VTNSNVFEAGSQDLIMNETGPAKLRGGSLLAGAGLEQHSVENNKDADGDAKKQSNERTNAQPVQERPKGEKEKNGNDTFGNPRRLGCKIEPRDQRNAGN
jgi:hypothetical protein